MSKRRIALVREQMRHEGLDALIVSSLPNVRYLTGFSGTNGLCVIRKKSTFFLTDGRYVRQSKAEVRASSLVIAKNGLFEEAAQRRLFQDCHFVGFESHTLTYAQYRTLKKLVSGVSFVSTKDVVEEVALVKEKKELDHIRAAVRISDRVFSELLHVIKPGVAELDVAAEISYLHKKFGAEKDAFEPIVASGERGSIPHARASAKKIRHRELVTLDFGCTVRGYNSDITRTVAAGGASLQSRNLYDVVLDAQLEAIRAARAGLMARDLDAVARDRISARGYGRFFIHSLGHGLGLQVHERPRVSALSKERLVAGSVITIEPGVYIPRFGGVRIEDDVLLTSQGCEVLNKAPKNLLVV
jgi:Xaa-Pro aminopeptidase